MANLKGFIINDLTVIIQTSYKAKTAAFKGGRLLYYLTY